MSARKPIRKRRDGRRATPQSLVAQTESAIQVAFNDAVTGNRVDLTVPVFGTGVGLELSQFGVLTGVESAPAILTDPQTITAAGLTNPADLIWVSRDGGLKTFSNGKISGNPFNIT